MTRAENYVTIEFLSRSSNESIKNSFLFIIHRIDNVLNSFLFRACHFFVLLIIRMFHDRFGLSLSLSLGLGFGFGFGFGFGIIRML